MKLTTSFFFLIAAGSVLAQDTKPTLTCENGGNGGRQARHCEMKEQSVAYAGLLNIDGRQNGGVSVKGWDRADVLVRARIEAGAETDGDARSIVGQVRLNTSAGKIAADGPEMANNRNWSVSYEVFAPRHANVEINTHNGGVNISDISGNIQFTAVNGGVKLMRVNGNVKGETQNGGVHVQLAGSRWDGQGLDVKTVNGGVNVEVPANYSAQIETSTVNGGVKNDFAVAGAVPANRERQTKATIGSGGAPLRLTTTNGGVKIVKI